MPLLSRPLALHDLDDVEELAAQIVQFSGLTLSHHEREDLTTYLLETAWELSLRYDPSGITSFKIWARRILQGAVSTSSASTEAEPGGHSQPVRMNGHAPSSYHSTASAALMIDWVRLSPRSMAILRLVANPLSEGYSQAEIAHELGTSMRWVSDRLDELRAEIERQ